MKTKAPRFIVATVLTLSAFCTYAADSHIAAALMHAEAAAQAANANAVVEHAEASSMHAKVADEHLDAGIKSLNSAVEHGKMGHADIAKKAAEEAVTHLKAAQ